MQVARQPHRVARQARTHCGTCESDDGPSSSLSPQGASPVAVTHCNNRVIGPVPHSQTPCRTALSRACHLLVMAPPCACALAAWLLAIWGWPPGELPAVQPRHMRLQGLLARAGCVLCSSRGAGQGWSPMLLRPRTPSAPPKPAGIRRMRSCAGAPRVGTSESGAQT